jgi:tetratricopeptide (TPR) repeat protein
MAYTGLVGQAQNGIGGKHAGAENLLHVALLAAEESYGSHHPAVAMALSNLGLWYKSSGRFDEAEFLYQRALTIAGPDCIESAAVYYNLASLEQGRGRFERAELYIRQASEIRLRFRTTEHPDYATDESLLAAILDAQGRFHEAEHLYWHALSVFEHTLGAEHHEIAVHLNNMAANCYGRRDFGAAEALYRRALDIKSKKLGDSHPSYEITAKNLALVRRMVSSQHASRRV